MAEVGDQQPGGPSGTVWLSSWIRALNWQPATGSTEWLGVFQGHEIRVVTRGLLRARLYLDGKLLDMRSPLLCLDRRVPLLSGRIPLTRFEVDIVHVYYRGPWRTQIEVRVGRESVPMNPDV